LDIYAVDIREHGLPFADNSFEFVMQRLSTPAFSSDQWKYVVGELIRVTQPGGYLQFIEIDYNTQGLGPAGQAWQDKCK
jgi:ubiquinone/menaquinone biosynthesis C-methylase UbiE